MRIFEDLSSMSEWGPIEHEPMPRMTMPRTEAGAVKLLEGLFIAVCQEHEFYPMRICFEDMKMVYMMYKTPLVHQAMSKLMRLLERRANYPAREVCWRMEERRKMVASREFDKLLHDKPKESTPVGSEQHVE